MPHCPYINLRHPASLDLLHRSHRPRQYPAVQPPRQIPARFAAPSDHRPRPPPLAQRQGQLPTAAVHSPHLRRSGTDFALSNCRWPNSHPAPISRRAMFSRPVQSFCLHKLPPQHARPRFSHSRCCCLRPITRTASVCSSICSAVAIVAAQARLIDSLKRINRRPFIAHRRHFRRPPRRGNTVHGVIVSRRFQWMGVPISRRARPVHSRNGFGVHRRLAKIRRRCIWRCPAMLGKYHPQASHARKYGQRLPTATSSFS